MLVEPRRVKRGVQLFGAKSLNQLPENPVGQVAEKDAVGAKKHVA